MTSEELDERLIALTEPVFIVVGVGHPISSWPGFNQPWSGWYRGVRVITNGTVGDEFIDVQPLNTSPSNYDRISSLES